MESLLTFHWVNSSHSPVPPVSQDDVMGWLTASEFVPSAEVFVTVVAGNAEEPFTASCMQEKQVMSVFLLLYKQAIPSKHLFSFKLVYSTICGSLVFLRTA